MKINFLKHIPDCLKCDRVRGDIINEVNSLNSIIKPFSNNLMDNKLLIIRRKL